MKRAVPCKHFSFIGGLDINFCLLKVLEGPGVGYGGKKALARFQYSSDFIHCGSQCVHVQVAQCGSPQWPSQNSSLPSGCLVAALATSSGSNLLTWLGHLYRSDGICCPLASLLPSDRLCIPMAALLSAKSLALHCLHPLSLEVAFLQVLFLSPLEQGLANYDQWAK